MTVCVKLSKLGDLIELCRLSGSAPCQILATNKARTEEELVGRDVYVDLRVPALLRPIGAYYTNNGGKITM